MPPFIKIILSKINEYTEVVRCAIRKWWRPLSTVALAGTLWVHGVILPLWTKTAAELTGLSLVITAVVAAFAVREWGKSKGND